MSGGGEAFAERVTELRRSGFDVTAPSGDDASEEMLHLERKAQQGKKLKRRIDALPDRWADQRGEFISRLADPAQVDAVQADLNGLLRRNRPWVLAAERASSQWSEEGRSVELSRVLTRLDAIDEELVFGATRLIGLIEEVAPMRQILPIIVEVEERQNRRTTALSGMVEMLESKGWDVEILSVGGLHSRFGAADRLRRLDMQLSRIHRIIEADIRPFDGVLAEKLWAASVLAQQEAAEVSMLRVEEEVEKRASELVQRLIRIESRLSRWMTDGFHLGAELPLLPHDLLDWESKNSYIEEKIEATHALWAQIVPYLDQWPEHRKLAERTRGHIEAVDALEVLLKGLEAKTEAARKACRNRLEEWSSVEIDISLWVDLYEIEPRAVEEELSEYQNVVDVIMPIIEGLCELDLTCSSGSVAGEWLAQIRSPLPSAEALEGATEYLINMQKRNLRHRQSLDVARDSVIDMWPSDVDSSMLDLESYEKVIVALESGDPIHEALAPAKLDTRQFRIQRRLATGLSDEIDGWASLGWDITGLVELSERDPLRLGLDLPEIRSAMRKHESLRNRLSTLPWSRNVSLAERVQNDLSRPERLPALLADIPELMRMLSESDEGISEYDFSPFIPTPPRALLISRIPVLIPMIPGEDAEEPEDVEGSEEPEEIDAPDVIIPEISKEVAEAHARGAVALGEMIGDADNVRLPEVKGPPIAKERPYFSTESEITDTVDSGELVSVDWTEEEEVELEGEAELDDEFATLIGKTKVKQQKTAQPPTETAAEVTSDDISLGRIATSLGIGPVNDVAELTDALAKVIDPAKAVPMDIRVRRLARMMLSTTPTVEDNDEQRAQRERILANLCSLATRLERWTGERLTNRRASSGAGLIEDSILLANRLEEIPGPGIQIPTEPDTYLLPAHDDLAGLSVAAARLTRAVKLPSAAIAQESEAAV